MNVEKIIAGIPKRTAAERKTMRESAIVLLQSGQPAQIEGAQRLLIALDAHEAALVQARSDLVQNLAGKPLVQRVLVAFQQAPPSQAEEQLIQVLLDHPGSICAQLSVAIGHKPNTWDMGFGSLCSERASFLRDLGGTAAEGRSNKLLLLTLAERNPDGAICYTMKPEAVTAFRQLGFRVKQA